MSAELVGEDTVVAVERKLFEGSTGPLFVCPRPGHSFDELSVVGVVENGGKVEAKYLKGLDMDSIEEQCVGIAPQVMADMRQSLLDASEIDSAE